MGVRYDLKLALRIQIFEYLLETFYRHALEHLQSARSAGGKNEKIEFIFFCPAETPGHYVLTFRRPVVGGDTFSPLAAVLGPEQKQWLCHPLPLFMAVSMIPNMWHSSILHAAFMADKILGGKLELARTIGSFDLGYCGFCKTS